MFIPSIQVHALQKMTTIAHCHAGQTSMSAHAALRAVNHPNDLSFTFRVDDTRTRGELPFQFLNEKYGFLVAS